MHDVTLVYTEYNHRLEVWVLGKRAANTTADRQQYTNTSKVCDDTMSMVLTNKIPYSMHNSIALIFCINCLYMPFNEHSNYNADSNTKTSNYSKVRFKPLIYFELQVRNG